MNAQYLATPIGSPTLAATPVHHVRTTCRACAADSLRRFLSLGPQPLANAFPRDQTDVLAEQYFPLDVYFCESCSLVQLADVIDPAVLFSDYIYVTGTSATIAEHNVRYAEAVAARLALRPGDRVVEVASNDGSLLSCFQRHGVDVLGVEPARNIASMAIDRGVPTDNRFFNNAVATELRAAHGPARAVIGNNVLAHVDDARDFLRGFATLLSDDGLGIVEVPYAREMLERLEYDTIYHEHLCYFTVTSMARLAEAARLSLVHVDRVPVHGGSLRVYLKKSEAQHGEQPRAMMRDEDARGLADFATWHEWASLVARNRHELRLLLEDLNAKGKRVAAYGAPAKGNTLLNYCGIDPTLVPFTVDKNPLKVGRLTPGMHIPVRAVDTLMRERPDYVLILAWNFADEIMQQQAAYREQGGRFIIPVPTPVIV
ncbi:MAG: class I SAM-dependent methyltransferase [Gemmatimonadaceae bacterium]